ncbi:MAG: hypothetical protein K2K81_03795 [Muribaculaceae bacterium]|nr:hypothetical protein [Muribaculaceae bacterium]
MARYNDLSIDGTSRNIVSNDGFVEVGNSGMRTTEITDSAVVNETALNKMATSIPTPFARLYLYDTAFEELNALESKDGNKGKAYKATGGDITLYHHLVAECLDLLEFIFEYGEDKRFTIHEWDVNVDTALLGATATPNEQEIIDDESYGDNAKKENPIKVKHAKLGTALRDAILHTSLKSALKIFIFKWEGEIIGGTSPFTLVYTSPNWRRKMSSKKWRFYGGKGNVLFPPIEPTTKVCSLVERSADFRTFMYALADKFNPDFSLAKNAGGQLLNMYMYIHYTFNSYESTPAGITSVYNAYNTLIRPNLNEYFEKNYKDLKLTSGGNGESSRPPHPVTTGGVSFFTKVMKPDRSSDYLIQPTVDTLPVETNLGGQKINMAHNPPLVLSSTSLGDYAKYWYRTPYNPATLPAKPEGEYFERTLPGVPGNPKYPYITESDLFEDSIMKLGYMIDNKRFFTGFNGNCEFLLPLKPTFFKFFKAEDLPKMVKVIPEGFPICKRVTVSISIPVKGGKVNFTRTYEPDKGNQFIDFSNDGPFKLGIFPFYTYNGTSAEDEDLYKILVARMTDLNLEFYNKDFVTPLDGEIVSRKKRTEEGKKITEYYTVGTSMAEHEGGKSGTFTAIRLVKNGIGGMIVPLFKQAEVTKDKYVFCVDFGTANTNVAFALAKPYTTNEGSELRVADNEIKTLEYSKESAQMGMLNMEGSEGMTTDLNPMIEQEFVPEAIGTKHLKFPIRTMACTRYQQSQGEQDLFGDVNIAFRTDKYGNSKKLYSYPTELKWSLDNNVKKLTEAVFQELLWICKNKVAELDGDPEFEFYFTYPQTMQNTVSLMRGWSQAAKKVRTKAHIFNQQVRSANGKRLNLYEGIAPWYRAISKKEDNVYYNDEFLNIDIGGGSTDVIFIQSPVKDSPREMKGFSFSAKFAANDLWGDGVSGKDKTNGFLEFFEKEIKPLLDTKAQKNFEEYAASSTNSEDVIGYIFSNRNNEFVEQLIVNDKMRLPMLVHFASIIYYVGRTLAMAQLQMPKHIYFSGMGSLYLKYITEDSDYLSEIIRAIFKYAGLKVVDKEGREKSLNVGFTENPKKVTAEGALLMYNATKAGLTDKVVKSEELNYHLYAGEEDEEDEVEIKIDNVDKYSEPVKKEVDRFLKLFSDKNFIKATSNLEGNTQKLNADDFRQWAAQGFDLSKNHEHPTADSDRPIKDVLFFWPLKHGIYMLGREMANLATSHSKK